MGLNTSKHTSPPSSSLSSSSSSSSVRRSRSSRRVVLKTSCLRSHYSSKDDTQVSGCLSEENGNTVSCSSINKSRPCHVSAKSSRKDKAVQSDEMNCITSDSELDEWCESSFNGTVSRETSSSSRTLSSRSLNFTSRFLSRFNLYPGNLSFRLNSSRAHPDGHAIPFTTTMKINDRLKSRDFFSACFTRSLRMQDEDSANNLQSGPSTDFSDNLQNNVEINPGDDAERIRNDTGVISSPELFSPCYGSEMRRANRRNSAREPAEPNVQFSRTLSVGRLRDRVLQRTRTPDLDLRHFQEDGEVRHTSHVNGRRGLGHSTGEGTSEDDNFHLPVSSNNVTSISSFPFYGNQNNGRETPQARETRYRDLLEHRSNFLVRRRRIRSQVRALQRLGSRFENLSGHERSCILSGQNRAGHCTCHTNGRDANSNDETTARASISRIVMLAEALFEVLDEIHQQSVVLTSQPSVSSIGSIPAPSEVVDSLPSKVFAKLKKKPSEEDAQCYICLVEYEEGDIMRILPCHHEFHLACVDKWLKEIHRICPLCRGDICRPESSTRGT